MDKTLASAFCSDPFSQGSYRSMIERAQRAFTDGKVDIAESTLRSVLATHPDQTEALESLGVVLAKTDRVKPAIELMQRLLEIDPQSVMA